METEQQVEFFNLINNLHVYTALRPEYCVA